MKRPRFKLRSVFIVVTLLSVPMGWVAYQLNWIRERHAFLAKIGYDLREGIPYELAPRELPWSLKWFGETPAIGRIRIDASELDAARKLFPEANLIERVDPPSLRYFESEPRQRDEV